VPAREIFPRPGGGKLCTANGRSNRVSVIDTATFKTIKTIPVGGLPRGVWIRTPRWKHRFPPEPPALAARMPRATAPVAPARQLSAAPVSLHPAAHEAQCPIPTSPRCAAIARPEPEFSAQPFACRHVLQRLQPRSAESAASFGAHGIALAYPAQQEQFPDWCLCE
jgi:YVTN family beta-propeller protein